MRFKNNNGWNPDPAMNEGTICVSNINPTPGPGQGQGQCPHTHSNTIVTRLVTIIVRCDSGHCCTANI